MEMTIDQASDAKIEAETAIRDAINRFMSATGLTIQEVQFHLIDVTTMEDRRSKTLCDSVRLRVELV